jgi:hypothetical protein
MADYTKRNPRGSRHGATPYGNVVAYAYSMVTNASGVVQDTDATAALGTADTVKLGIIPAGTRLLDAVAQVSDGFTATSTAKIGFAYVDGVDDANVPQDADYFFAALDLATAGITRKNNNAARPVTLPKDAYLVLDNDVAAQAAAGVLDITIIGEMVGA